MTKIAKLTREYIPLPSSSWKGQMIYIITSPDTITIKKVQSPKTDWKIFRKRLKKAGTQISQKEINQEIKNYRLSQRLI